MKDNTQEKNLIKRNDKNIFGKIKNFFENIFKRKEEKNEIVKEEFSESELEKSDGFKNYIKIGDNGIELMELQTRYRRGEISDNDLTQEQIDSLCMLYDKQIEEIKRQIEVKERKLSEYKRKNKGKIKENNA